jgi:hypothetical protein
MRKEYGKALRSLFSSQMTRAASHFEAVKVKSVFFSPGDRAWRWQANERLHCWIVLSPSKKDYDEFTVLIGWSRRARYPELSMVPCAELPTPGREEFAREEYLTRLPYLWGDDDQWWVVKEFRAAQSVAELAASLQPIPPSEARDAVDPQVRDPIGKIVEIGLPYLEALSHVVTDGPTARR